MEDTALFTLLLGIRPPWRVARVEVTLAGERIDVWVEEARACLPAVQETGSDTGMLRELRDHTGFRLANEVVEEGLRLHRGGRR